jgi:hypothetical protein
MPNKRSAGRASGKAIPPSGEVFRHRTLGELGRILLQDWQVGRSQLSCEVVGDPADLMTAERAAIFQRLGLALSARIEAATGPVTDPHLAPPPPPPDRTEVMESKLKVTGPLHDSWGQYASTAHIR